MPSKRQRKALGAYVRSVANDLELRDWTFDVSRDEPSDDTHFAAIRCTYGRKRATIKFRDDFYTDSAIEQREAVCHELIHAHLSGIEWQFANIGNHVSRDAYDMIWGGLKDQVEFATDALAVALAKHLPLPELPARKKVKA